ncbi:hypothetical protein NLG97_g1274 [Lecanicillium saksenae]|uniref:Uncharacterized protein n=1 Tax=Lecanicillium saksenae TaxID=468837 RepID=A0ACC1R469_9HYPO|nr:hypothetical protein NLG97_g1274 [Lecanicillium saksenae]
MPKSVEDAYLIISAHLHKTPATDATVRRIIEQRLRQLIEDNAVESALEPGSTTLLNHLARVQALLVLLIICLFDGDIRLRAQGELYLATLLVWNDQMLQVSIQSMESMRKHATLEPWRLWVFSESVRRTWLTTSITHSVYVNITQGYSSCPGGVYCTFGNGLWDAATAHEWEKKCKIERERFFMQSLDVGEVFPHEEPSTIDAFGNAIMLISSGVDKLQRWTTDKGGAIDS